MRFSAGLCLLAVIALAGCTTQSPAPPVRAAAAAPATGETLPPSEETAKERLERSPRHGEYVDVALPSGGTPIRTWVVYPDRKDKAGVVLVIHEVYGMSENCAMTTLNLPSATKIGTVGLALPGVELNIAEDGEILVRGISSPASARAEAGPIPFRPATTS